MRAVAAPARFPVPTWAAIAVAMDWNGVISPFSRFSPFMLKCPNTWRTPSPNFLTWMNLKRIV